MHFNLYFLSISSFVMSEISDQVDYLDFTTDVQLESDRSFQNPSENNITPWDGSLYTNSNEQTEDSLIPNISDQDLTIFESSCALPENGTSKKRRGNLCTDVKEKNNPQSGPPPGAQGPDQDIIPFGKEHSDSEFEPSPLSSSLFGLAYWELCPYDKTDHRVPFCCDFNAWGGGAQVSYCFDCTWFFFWNSYSRLLKC